MNHIIYSQLKGFKLFDFCGKSFEVFDMATLRFFVASSQIDDLIYNSGPNLYKNIQDVLIISDMSDFKLKYNELFLIGD